MKKTQVEVESRVVVGAHGVSAEEDHIIISKVVWVGVVSMLVFLLGGIWAWRIEIATEREVNPEGPAPMPAAVGQYEVGIVNQRLLELDAHAEQKIAKQHQALLNGWGEKPGQKVHLSIGEAMQRVVADQSKRETPPPAPEP